MYILIKYLYGQAVLFCMIYIFGSLSLSQQDLNFKSLFLGNLLIAVYVVFGKNITAKYSDGLVTYYTESTETINEIVTNFTLLHNLLSKSPSISFFSSLPL